MAARMTTQRFPAWSCVFLRATTNIGCLEMVGSRFRFSWRGEVSRPNERPPYVVSAADWLTLAEKFGLTPYLEETPK